MLLEIPQQIYYISLMGKFLKLLKAKIRFLIVRSDYMLFNERVRRGYYKWLMSKSLNLSFTHHLIANYGHKPTNLHELFQRYGSDKGSPYVQPIVGPHQYSKPMQFPVRVASWPRADL
jgi:hypothetical protein